ncbi:MAG: hypothetical protein U0872_12440 [Planctomycetaceae bacterium]
MNSAHRLSNLADQGARRRAIAQSCRAAGIAVRPVLFACVFLVRSAWGVEVSDPQWGFDGKVRVNRFNLLTLTVDNPSSVPVELQMVLQKSAGAGPIDAPLVEQVFLGPGARRTVQFYPYISHDWGGWRLSWKSGASSGTSPAGRSAPPSPVRLNELSASTDVPQPRNARRGARVLLESADVIGNSQGSLRRFPASAFPPFVTATDSLQAVVLDHVPRWDEPRRQAFLDWIYRGGAVFILHGPSGKHPEFPAAMHPLNIPLETIPFGAGVVHRLDLNRNQLSREEARKLWALLPNVAPPKAALEPGMPMAPGKDANEDEDDPNAPFAYSEGGAYGAKSFLDELKQMSKPEHNWLLLHFMFWVYILMVFPGCFLIGKRRNDFRIVYAALAGIVFVFSLAFGLVGQRGYGEATTVHTIAIAQPLPDGCLDIAGWSNAFVTGGAMYDIRHNGSGALYSTCQDTEAVNGQILNGAEGQFRVDIPPFSSREFAHRVKVRAAVPNFQLEKIAFDEAGLSELALTTRDEFPPAEDIYVVFRDRFYSVGYYQGRITLRNSVGAVPAFLRIEQNSGYYSPFSRMGDQRTIEQRFRGLFFPLVTRALDIQSLADAQNFRLSSEQLRLIYYTDLPAELMVQNPRFPSQKGKILYCLNIPLKETPAP